jgi:hypothetical protein
MHICEYGCGQKAEFQFKNGKWCCSKSFRSCLMVRKKNSKSQKGKILSEEHKKKIGKGNKGKTKGKIIGPQSEETKKKRSESMKGKNTGPLSEEHKRKIGHNLKYYKEKYPFFCRVEELKENEKGEIYGHCKNHKCENSKEKGGWFTPTSNQLNDRIITIENPRGFGESNFYCSQHCKDTCLLYRKKSDPFKDNILPYTYAEYLTCRAVVFERENTLCEYCGEPATDMHHIFSVKLEPFFALDPDYCVACCEKHHYKYAHKDECSTGNLAKIVCSVESQKFLNQKL